MRHRHHSNVALQIGPHLWSIVLPLVIGLALGALVLLSLRLARQRWTWALWGVPFTYLLGSIDLSVGFACGIATATAAGIGAYWHFEDSRRGGEDARRMREATGPAQFARSWAMRRSIRESRVQPAKQRMLGGATEDRLAIGTNRRGAVRHVPMGISRGVHAIVLGATGAGKTVTQAAIIEAYILAGLPVIVLDPKGDRYLCSVMQEAARKAGVAFRGWAPYSNAVYNPFARGGPTEITDKALAGHRWSEPHYEMATQRLLLHVLTTMRTAGLWPPTISQIVTHMDPERLDALASEVGGETAERVSAYVDGLSARGRSDLGGGRDRLAVLADGELGPLLDPALGDGSEINLAESLHKGEVVYFHIDADRYPAASKLLGAALVIDLVTLTADLQGGDLRGLLVIDEFAALAADQVSRLFGRGRSAGLSVLLGTQSLADLRGARPDDPSDTLTEQVLTNIEFAIVHREADPDSAERLARMAGTQASWSTTERVGTRRDSWWAPREGTRTREREFIVSPDEFKRLGVGEAVLINPTAKVPGEIVRILPPDGRRG